MFTALAGGVGAARFLAGLVQVVDPAAVTAIINTADDDEFFGLHVSPDIDSVVYTLAGAHNAEQGWGLAGETFRTIDAIDRFGEPTWFRIGDLDLATHVHRTHRLRSGTTLSVVTNDLATSWGIKSRLIPMSDDAVRTRVTVRRETGALDELAMQEWFVRERCEPAVASVRFEGAAIARPAPGALEALEAAEAIVLCPSNPIISIGPILAVSGFRELLERRKDRVIAISPIVGGAPVKGPADRLMGPLGVEVSALGVARHYAPFCATIVIDAVDAPLADAIEAIGVRTIVTDTMMRSPDIAAALARRTLEAVA